VLTTFRPRPMMRLDSLGHPCCLRRNWDLLLTLGRGHGKYYLQPAILDTSTAIGAARREGARNRSTEGYPRILFASGS